jgi:polysaccharide biosynthesis transport protein
MGQRKNQGLARNDVSRSGNIPALRRAPIEMPVEIERTDDLHLRRYINRIVRHKWLVLAVTLALTAIAAVILMARGEVYRAETRVQVDYAHSSSLGSAGVEPSTFVDRAYFNTQLELLVSPTLIRNVIRKLDLENSKDFNPAGAPTGNDTSARMYFNGAADSDDREITDEEARRLAPLVEMVKESLEVNPVLKARQTVKDTRLVSIGFVHKDPEIAAKITNTLADELVQFNMDKKFSTEATQNKYLRDNIRALEAQIRSDERKLVAFGRDHHLPTLDGSQNTVVERLVGLNRQLLEAENERKQAEAAYRAALDPAAASALAEESSRGITEIDNKLDELKQRREQLLVEMTEKYPEVQEVDKQITLLMQQAQDRRNNATRVLKRNLETRYRQAQDREASLREAFQAQRAQTQNQNEAAINHRLIQQSVETNKRLLDNMVQRSKENEMLKAKEPNNIQVVDYAVAPTEPLDQRTWFFLGLSGMFAFSFGVGLALLRDYFDSGLHTTDEIEKELSLPALAVIPRSAGSFLSRPQIDTTLQLTDGGTGDTAAVVSGGPELITNADQDSPLVEAIRRLRTAILLYPNTHKLRRILVTSSQKGEGKSTTATNLAISLARSGARVLLIDADLRNPKLHQTFNILDSEGLSDVLIDGIRKNPLSRYVVRLSTGLCLLPAGRQLCDSPEFLGSERMTELLTTLDPHFDFILIDSPPVTSFSDSTVLASLSDGVILVVQGSKSSQETVKYSTKILRMVGAKIIGVVLNKVSVTSESYYGQGAY